MWDFHISLTIGRSQIHTCKWLTELRVIYIDKQRGKYKSDRIHVEVVKIIYRHCASNRSGVELLADHRECGGAWGETEEKQVREGGRTLSDCSEGENRGTEEPPSLARRVRQIGWLITVLMHLRQQGHLVVPPPLPPPCCCPENPYRDDYRYDKEPGITPPLAVGETI